MIPITEQANELTLELDMADPQGIARLLRQGDTQLFAGFRTYAGLMDDEILAKAAFISQVAARTLLAGDKGRIFLSGAGTSGRFSHLLCRQFNRFLRAAGKKETFAALIAGGPLALVKAQEGAEDDPIQAVADLENKLPSTVENILYVGITCGLSAPYTAGHLHELGKNPKATSVLLGFNTKESARNVPIEGWHSTFKQVVEACETLGPNRFVLLNPIYGPESILGSTRMKGGTATKILLEAIFFAALELAGIAKKAEGHLNPDQLANAEEIVERLRTLLGQCRETIQKTYDHQQILGELIRQAGSSLRCGGRVIYIGRETAALMGLIDASECPPTFGASFDDIRCYINGGWGELMDNPGEDYTDSGPEFQIDLQSFERNKVEDLAKGDVLLGIAIGELGPNTRLVLEAAQKTKAYVGLLIINSSNTLPPDLPIPADHCHLIQIPSLGFAPGYVNLGELALKVAINSLSSGAHIMVGKIYNNRMIDLRISNNKLYFRAIRTIGILANVDEEQARLALHRAVYQTDSLTADQTNAAPSAVIAASTRVNRVVPIALLMARGSISFETASEMLSRDPVPRRVINQVLGQAVG
ncbi:MAG: hypothetical protein SFY68_15140 [Candidatus Sumerlaeia bacterium]|nr:hypothetical protein [Candidatus Sumerlaeia bacterium]